MLRLVLPTLFALLCVGCASAPDLTPRAVPATTKIAVVVEQDTLLAGKLQSQVAGDLRQMILETRNGIPVVEATNADMVLKVSILAVNTTNATQWEWQLIDVDSGAIVLSASDTSGWGLTARGLASRIVAEIGKVDLSPWGSGSDTAVAAAQPLTEQRSETVRSETDGSNAWAVVVGIERYRDELPSVTGAERDAAAFARYARGTLNVPESNIKTLVGERATRSDIAAALGEWLPRNATADGGRVYVYFAGHGAPDVETGDGFLLPYDANPTYVKSGGVRVESLLGDLAKLERQNVFVFLDACFSGRGDRSVLAEGTRPVVPVKEIGGAPGVTVLAAAGATQTTGAHESGEGLFTHHLLNGLRGEADANADGDIAIDELREYVTERVSADARRQNREQTPSVAGPAGFAKTILVDDLQRRSP